MANKVSTSPNLPRPPSFGDLKGLYNQFFILGKTLFELFSSLGIRANLCLPSDGTEQMTAPLPVAEYAKADLPAAASWQSGVVSVNNETGGYTLAFSDGTNWRRVQDRAVVS